MGAAPFADKDLPRRTQVRCHDAYEVCAGGAAAPRLSWPDRSTRAQQHFGEEHMTSASREFDAVVIGAGFSGMYMLKTLRDSLAMKVRVYEAGETVGGTWYWNRYPGARCDSEAYVYCFTWDKDLLQEWEWSERYPEQPEILRYLEHVAARHDLKRDICFNTRVTGAEFDDATARWRVYTDASEVATARFLITAVGTLSDTNLPPFEGLEGFRGKWYHTSRFPRGGVDFTAKRVAVVGTGASAVQAIPEIAPQAKQLTVFQRTPNYCLPARNGKVDPERVAARKADYAAIVERTRNSFAGFELARIAKSALEATPEEREREFERMWDIGGFIFGLGNYQDVLLNPEANKIVSEYLGNKIRRAVKDPVVAEKLVPKKHPFGTKRTPLDTNYYETFNKDNVLLIDADTDGPVEAITETGLRAGGREYEFDIIVFATGFDAFTGSLKALNIKGRSGRALNDAWADGPRTYLGVAVAGFPNLFTITGPQSPSVLANMPVAIEQHVEWIADCIAYLREHGRATIEAVPEAQESWVAHVNEVVSGTLLPRGNSWWMSANIPGKPRVFLPYLGPEGIGGYRRRCAEIAAKGYEGFIVA
jgi:cation diffusion facilitator CzcD-associated flavoprotein CzcO